MVRLMYSAIASLDGYVADADGRFDWAEPDDEVHAFVNDLERSVGTYLYGRRMYEVMAAWETMDAPADQPIARDFAAIWREADKVVYSRTLETVATPRTRLERAFDPGTVRRLKESADRDISIGGPGLAAEALAAGLVDECHLFLSPVVVGGGTRALPDGLRLRPRVARRAPLRQRRRVPALPGGGLSRRVALRADDARQPMQVVVRQVGPQVAQCGPDVRQRHRRSGIQRAAPPGGRRSPPPSAGGREPTPPRARTRART